MFVLKVSSESKLFGGGPPCPLTTSATKSIMYCSSSHVHPAEERSPIARLLAADLRATPTSNILHKKLQQLQEVFKQFCFLFSRKD